MPRLLIHHAGEGSRVFELFGDRPITIGRAKSSTVVLDDPSVSRTHVVVRAVPEGGWQIIDRDSANGVKINGIAKKEATLRPDDEIILGEYKIRYEDSAVRKVITYGTAKLPPRITQTLKKSAYTGSFQPVEAVADGSPAEQGRHANAAASPQALEHENRLLKLLHRVNSTLAGFKTVEQVTHCALDLVLEINGAERGYMMLVDDASMLRGNFSNGAYSFEPAILRYRGGSNMLQGQGAPQLAISQSIIRKVMEAGMPLLVSDAQSDPRLAASKSVAAAGIQSAMCAPLGIGEKLRGLLYVDNLSRRGMFAVEELNSFSVIAVQAGLAIGRVRTRSEVLVPVTR